MIPGFGPRMKLCPEAEEALDALINSGWDPERVPEPYRACARELVAQFGLACEEAPGAPSELIEATIRRLVSHPVAETSLSNASADALDLWSMSGYRAGSVPKSMRAQADRHESISALISRAIEAEEADVSEALVESTIKRIAEIADVAEPSSFVFPIRARLSDIVSVAAVLLIGVSVVLPVLSSFRFESMRKHNEANFAVASVAFGSYASDYEGRLPVYTPSQELIGHAPGGRRLWWMVGLDPLQSNSANLYTLARLGYASLDSLASPGNENAVRAPESPDAVDWGSLDQVSYSLRILQGAESDDRWAKRALVVLADRSPVIRKAYQRQPIDPFENSPNHDGRGQHILRGDGSVDWLSTPWMMYSDQIYLPRFVERLVHPDVRGAGMVPLQGSERPESAADAFVGP